MRLERVLTVLTTIADVLWTSTVLPHFKHIAASWWLPAPRPSADQYTSDTLTGGALITAPRLVLMVIAALEIYTSIIPFIKKQLNKLK